MQIQDHHHPLQPDQRLAPPADRESIPHSGTRATWGEFKRRFWGASRFSRTSRAPGLVLLGRIKERHGFISVVLARGLRPAVLRSAFSQSDAGGSDTPSGHDRSSATTGIGGMPGVLRSVATRSQHVLAPTARSAVAGSAGDHPRRRAAVPLLESELHPSDVRRAPHGSCPFLAVEPGG